ncbi:hypothetical protein FQA39_LY02152 [Lamprigera yunnana]|nr:hypothetical protein FQA39_LY02152 [Lamprigera yunnana]
MKLERIAVNTGGTSGKISTTQLAAKADRKGLIGIECSRIDSTLRQVLSMYKGTPESTCFHSRNKYRIV